MLRELEILQVDALNTLKSTSEIAWFQSVRKSHKKQSGNFRMIQNLNRRTGIFRD